MKLKSLMMGAVLLFVCGLTELRAQTAIPATGGDATGAGGSAAYTVGQAVYYTNTDGNNSEAQGVQQPYEISITTGISHANGIALECKAYPNPTTDFLTLSVESFEGGQLSYRLYDISGRLLDQNNLTNAETKISMWELTPATYYLVVMDDQSEVRTFQIIKH